MMIITYWYIPSFLFAKVKLAITVRVYITNRIKKDNCLVSNKVIILKIAAPIIFAIKKQSFMYLSVE